MKKHFPTLSDEVKTFLWSLIALLLLGMLLSQHISFAQASGREEGAVSQTSSPPQPTNLRAFHCSGQTFLTYQEQLPQGAKYRMYQSPSAILTPADLANATFLGEVNDRTSENRRESFLAGTTVYYVINPGQPPLGALDGLYVHTTAAAGSFFYAVTRVSGAVENTSITAGQGGNSLTTAVVETVVLPEPVLQGTQTLAGLPSQWYVQWTNHIHTPAIPATANQPGVTYMFALQNVQAGGAPQPLMVGGHGGTGSYKTAIQNTGNPNELRMSLDEPQHDFDLPQTADNNLNTAWFGYNTNYFPGGASGNLLAGVNTNYTQRRVLAEIL